MDSRYENDRVTRLETNLDDCSPELLGAVMQKLFSAGALDVWFTPIQMKKGRPGTMLALLCDPQNVPELADIIFRETTAFGIRQEQVLRLKLARRVETVSTPFGEVRVKLGTRAGEVIQISPEFESCREVSEQSRHPLRVIYEAAARAYREGSADR